ncbi:MAG TPA: radical SAM protein [Candidatus Krumholzibacterium sp.]|nr:radical SAM protein [Candidatus Krumholzibacterium sp.]
MPDYEHPLYRPPSEAQSLIFQVTSGCSHNGCAFCYMYKEKAFRIKPWDELKREIDEAALEYPRARRVFLADGDAFVLATADLSRILEHISASFPQLQRVTAYAAPSNLLAKSVREMSLLREKGLTILYFGVESGDPEILAAVGKGATPDEMAEGCARATEAGMKLSVTVILGLAGREGSLAHARMTAALINRIRPRYLSALTLMLGPYRDRFLAKMNALCAEGVLPGERFEFNDAAGDLAELREMIAGLECDRCIFRSNHASNYLPLAGTLIKDRQALLDTVDMAMEDPDRFLRGEWMRGL